MKHVGKFISRVCNALAGNNVCMLCITQDIASLQNNHPFYMPFLYPGDIRQVSRAGGNHQEWGSK